MRRTVGLACAAVLVSLAGTSAFAPAGLTAYRGLAISGNRRGMQVSMSGGFGPEQGEKLNRQARRQMAKQEKKAKIAKPARGADAFNEASAVMAESMSGRAPTKVEAPNALEELRQKTLRDREDAITRLRDVKAGKVAPPKRELPLIDNPNSELAQLRSVDPSVLFGVERFLFFGAFTGGAVWVLAGLGTAFDAYLISTKQKVPGDADNLVSTYLYPLLTPGLVGIIGFSLLLGLLQVYKFEGGKAAAAPDRFVRKSQQGKQDEE